jgi:hypothetical protein
MNYKWNVWLKGNSELPLTIEADFVTIERDILVFYRKGQGSWINGMAQYGIFAHDIIVKTVRDWNEIELVKDDK